MTAAEKTTLVNAINNVISANGGSVARRCAASSVRCSPPRRRQLTPAFKTLLLNWANDLLGRL